MTGRQWFRLSFAMVNARTVGHGTVQIIGAMVTSVFPGKRFSAVLLNSGAISPWGLHILSKPT